MGMRTTGVDLPGAFRLWQVLDDDSAEARALVRHMACEIERAILLLGPHAPGHALADRARVPVPEAQLVLRALRELGRAPTHRRLKRLERGPAAVVARLTEIIG